MAASALGVPSTLRFTMPAEPAPSFRISASSAALFTPSSTGHSAAFCAELRKGFLLVPSRHRGYACRRVCSSLEENARLAVSSSSSSETSPLPSTEMKTERKPANIDLELLGKKKKDGEDDPWESFFQQLEKDLENDTDGSIENGITEEDVASFEKELDTLLQDIENVSTNDNTAEFTNRSKAFSKDHMEDIDDDGLVHKKILVEAKQNDRDDHQQDLVAIGEGSWDYEKTDLEPADNSDGDFSDDDFEEPRTVSLQKWQVRKLAAAVELGRRKVHIKNLAAELKLNRDDVLYFLKSPPPELLMAVNESKENEDESEALIPGQDVDANIEMTNDSLGNSNGGEAGVTVKPTYGPRDWHKQKRIKKVNLLTLQRVFRRTKWPSNSMIESVVRATHLPRAQILTWFEEERARVGIQSPPTQNAASRKLWRKPVAHSFDRL